NKADVEEAQANNITESDNWPVRGYCFYTDGRMVKYPRGYLEPGRWSLSESSGGLKIIIVLDDGDKDTAQVGLLTPYTLKIKTSYNGLQEYSGTALRHNELKDEPFYPANNLWRIKPDAPE